MVLYLFGAMALYFCICVRISWRNDGSLQQSCFQSLLSVLSGYSRPDIDVFTLCETETETMIVVIEAKGRRLNDEANSEVIKLVVGRG